MSKQEDFVRQAQAHYQAKLEEETQRFGVVCVSDEFVEHNSRILPDLVVWEDLAKATGKCYEPFLVDAQVFVLVVSESPIPRPTEYYALWLIVNETKGALKPENLEVLPDSLENLHWYDGPYKLEVPKDLFED